MGDIMSLEAKQLYELQKGLDLKIIYKHDNANYEDTRNKRILALLVELSELANETRCFKYWSLKDPSSKEVIFEEYVDGIHFLLSLGFYFDEQPEDIEVKVLNKELTEAFLDVYSLFAKMLTDNTYNTYLDCFKSYLGLGLLLGITMSELKDFYVLKNEKNHQRQENNY